MFGKIKRFIANRGAYLDKLTVLLVTGCAKLVRSPAVIITGELTARKFNPISGYWEDLGLLSCRMVTDAGVAFMATDWLDNTTDISTFNYHDSGTGTTAEAVGDTGLVTPTGEARDSGVKTKPAANQLKTVATHTYAGTFAITEHGIFSAASAGTLWDRSVFAAINVVASDKIEFTYAVTINSGG